MLEEIFNIDLPLELKEVGNLMLPVTGTLLGLVYTGLIYWLDAGLARLESTRTLLEDSVVADGKVLLDLLVGASLMSLFAVTEARGLASVCFWLFSLRYFKDVLNSIAEHGYITTIFSTKYIPKNYGPIRIYLRKIRNSGLFGLIRFMIYAFPVVIYPIAIKLHVGQSQDLLLPDMSIKVFIFVTSIFSLIQVRSLLVQAISVRKQLDKSVLDENYEKSLKMEDRVEWSQDKIKINFAIVEERLSFLKILSTIDIDSSDWTSRDILDKPVIKGRPMVNKQGNVTLQLVTPYLTDDELTRDYIFLWTRKLLGTLSESKAEIQHYTLTFYRRDTINSEVHLALFRAIRSDALRAKDKISDFEFIKKLEGKFLSHAIAEF